jgi:hypothetical protein
MGFGRDIRNSGKRIMSVRVPMVFGIGLQSCVTLAMQTADAALLASPVNLAGQLQHTRNIPSPSKGLWPVLNYTS